MVRYEAPRLSSTRLRHPRVPHKDWGPPSPTASPFFSPIGNNPGLVSRQREEKHLRLRHLLGKGRSGFQHLTRNPVYKLLDKTEQSRETENRFSHLPKQYEQLFFLSPQACSSNKPQMFFWKDHQPCQCRGECVWPHQAPCKPLQNQLQPALKTHCEVTRL